MPAKDGCRVEACWTDQVETGNVRPRKGPPD